MHGSETVPLNGPDEKHKLWGKELQGLGAQTATTKFEGSGGVQRTLDRIGVPRDLSGQITPQRASGTYDTLAKIPPFESPSSQGPRPKRASNASVIPPSGGGGGYSPESTQTEPAEKSDGLLGKHFYFGGSGEKSKGEPFSGDMGVGWKSDSSNYIQPATTKEAVDEYWEKMRGPRSPGIKYMKP